MPYSYSYTLQHTHIHASVHITHRYKTIEQYAYTIITVVQCIVRASIQSFKRLYSNLDVNWFQYSFYLIVCLQMPPVTSQYNQNDQFFSRICKCQVVIKICDGRLVKWLHSVLHVDVCLTDIIGIRVIADIIILKLRY